MMRRLYNRKVIITLLSLWHATVLLAQDGYIQGTVTNGVEKLSNANVSLGTQTRVTNRNGEFSFQAKAGKYNLLITYVGYNKIEDTITFRAGETKYLNYELTPLEQIGEEVLLHSLSGRKRSNFNTPVSVDAIGSKTLLQTGQPSLVQMLSATVPSVNISRPQTWDPVTFRGFDQFLLLVDGIRYHPRSSLGPIQQSTGQLGKGSVVNDLYAIPFSAIEKIEILHDGASAQFGSDAIAAVVNIHLKKSTGKTSIQLHTGQCYKNDGENIEVGINRGISIGKKGFLNVSANFHHRAPTFRGKLYEGTVYYQISSTATNQQKDSIIALDNQKIAERGFDRSRVPPGYESQKLYSVGFLVNGGTPIKKNMELFWTTILNYRYPTYPAAYRYPKNPSQVNTDLYPDGFLPIQYSPVWDFSIKAGAKGITNNNWKWNFSSSYGKNKITLETHNNNNASQQFLLGNKAPTDFNMGGTSFSQFLNNVNFVKNIKTPNSRLKSINIAFGAESRLENYQIQAGEEASWKNYDPTARKQGGAQGAAFSDSNEVNVYRHVTAIYADIETEINDRLLIDKAVRFEYYSGFGSNLAGKLAARYKFSDKFSLRGSVSNSFRAPSLQQAYFSSTSNNFINGVPAVIGIFRNDHDVISRGFGVPKLKPEKAINISGGVTSFISSRFNITIDAYWIQIKNRIGFSGRFDTSNLTVKYILQQQFSYISGVLFACNAVNTRTTGVDIVINSRWDLFKGQLGFTLAANFNRTRVFGIIQSASNLPADPLTTNTLVNRGDIGRLEKIQPSSKIIFTTFYKKGKWALTLTSRRFGSTEFIHESNSSRDEFFSAKIVTDLNIKFSPKTWYNITVGCNNIFNVTPDPLKNYDNTSDGRLIYSSQYLPFSPNGGYYFVSMSFNF